MAEGDGIRFVIAATHIAVPYFQSNGDDDVEILDFSRREHLAAIDRLCEGWERLRQAGGQVTRYNSPVAFQRRVAVTKPGDRQPFACALEVAGEITAVVVGKVHFRPMDDIFIGFKLPFLDLPILKLPESGVIDNGNRDQLKLLFDHLMQLMERGRFDLLEYRELDAGSAWAELITTSAEFNDRANIRHDVRWQTEVLDTITGERLQHHSSKTRKNIRQRDKKLSKAFDGDVSLEKIDRSEQVDRFVQEAGYIVSQGYQAALGIGIRAGDEAQRAYLHELAEESSFRAYLLRVKGKAIAYAQGDLQRKNLYLWSTSYLPEYRDYAPGIVLMHRIIEEIAEEGIELLDFGCGDAVYKQRFGSRKLDIISVRLCARRLHPRLICLLDRVRFKMITELRRGLGSQDHFIQARSYLRGLRNIKYKYRHGKKDGQ